MTRFFVFCGSAMGLILVTSLTLLEPLLYDGPGDPVGTTLALWPIVVPMQIVIGSIGCVVGGIAGFAIHSICKKLLA